jgi:hypothetical protein
MDTATIISELKKHAGFFEVHHQTTFECVRTAENGETQEVTVEILDAGPNVRPAKLRYHCRATTTDGKMATGNPEESIEDAILHVHWWDLDR